MTSLIPFPVKGPFFPCFKSLSKKVLMKDPVIRNTGQKSLPFVPESRSPLVDDSETRAESLADSVNAEYLFDNLKPLQIGLGKADGHPFDDFLHSHNSTQTVATKTVLQPVRHHSDVTSTPEISGTVTNCDVAQLAKVTGLNSASLPLDWLLGPKNATSPYTKVLAALVRLEARANKEHDVCEAEDFRQTWLAVRYLETGECTMLGEAIALACLRMFGVNIHQLQNKITARRMAKLGKEFSDWFDANGKLIPDSEVLARKNGELGAGQAGECPTTTQQPPIALPGISSLCGYEDNGQHPALVAGSSDLSGHASPTTASHKGPGNAVAHEMPAQVSKKPAQSIPSSQVKEEKA